jgi:hypothetical protein
MSDEILVDPAGLAQIANTIGGSLAISVPGEAPSADDCGSEGVAAAVALFAESHAN